MGEPMADACDQKLSHRSKAAPAMVWGHGFGCAIGSDGMAGRCYQQLFDPADRKHQSKLPSEM